MVFYMWTCFISFKSPILHVQFYQNLSTMNTLDPYFYRTLFLRFLPMSPRSEYLLHLYSDYETWNYGICDLQLLIRWDDTRADATVESVYEVELPPRGLCGRIVDTLFQLHRQFDCWIGSELFYLTNHDKTHNPHFKFLNKIEMHSLQILNIPSLYKWTHTRPSQFNVFIPCTTASPHTFWASG